MHFIKIDGVDYPVKFGLSALKTAMAKYKLTKLVETDVLLNSIEIEYMPFLLKLGVDNGCRIMVKDAPDIEVVKDAFENDLSLMTKSLNVFAADISGEEPEKGKKPEAQKKKILYKK